MKKRKYLILHCSDEPNNRKTKGSDIMRWHTSSKSKGGRGWRKAGYEQVVRRDGTVDVLYKNDGDEFVDSFEITNGARGYNSRSKSICLIGGTASDGSADLELNAEMHDALIGIVKDTISDNPDILIGGHYNFSDYKTCPNFDVEKWLLEAGVNRDNIIGVNTRV